MLCRGCYIKIFLAALLALFTAGPANAGPENARFADGLDAWAGLRVDQFDWNIAGSLDGTGPDVLSELTWSDLDIFELRLRARRTAGPVYFRGSFGYGFIFDGANQDSDFNGDNRTLEFSRSNNGAGGTVWDASIGAGYAGWAFNAGQGVLRVIPLAGYSLHKQNLTIVDGFQTIPPTGSFAALDSSYRALWTGPWAGVDIDYGAGGLALYGSFEVHAASYEATADWNLRTDFMHPKSFEHSASGVGILFNIGAGYDISPELTIKAVVERKQWRASDGTDRTFFADGAVVDTRLNEVNWSSTSVAAGVEYRF